MFLIVFIILAKIQIKFEEGEKRELRGKSGGLARL
jgi:hypothetical protein